MMADVNEFVPDPEGMDEMARSDWMTAAMYIVAEGMADDIRSLTPVGVGPESPGSDSAPAGAMAESITVIPNEDGAGPVDWGVRVAAMDWRFHWVEFGTGGRVNDSGAWRGMMPAYGPFRRVAETADKFVPEGAGAIAGGETP